MATGWNEHRAAGWRLAETSLAQMAHRLEINMRTAQQRQGVCSLCYTVKAKHGHTRIRALNLEILRVLTQLRTPVPSVATTC